jgi:hypothetical protein
MPEFFYGSAELRWFFQAQPSQWSEFLNWFKRHDELVVMKEKDNYKKDDYLNHVFVKLEKTREDKYLLFPDCDTVSVKQRGGNLEVKALVSGPRPFSLPTVGTTGRIDQWVKWSFASRFNKDLVPELDKAGPWASVTKDRYLQKYSFDSGRMALVSPDTRPNWGCNVELTKVTIDHDATAWSTFGFEAFGPAGRVTAMLDEAVGDFFTTYGPAPVQLEGRDSLSYPTWLAMNLADAAEHKTG